jgi:hypothetical protein
MLRHVVARFCVLAAIETIESVGWDRTYKQVYKSLSEVSMKVPIYFI